MAYTKTSWVARIGTALNRFLKTNELAGSVELTNDPTGVTTGGTPFTVANMNKIETGIYDAHVTADYASNTADANRTLITTNTNQGVKTTDSPTFVAVNTGQGANEVFKNSTEDIGFSYATTLTVYRYVAPMDIGETRFVYAYGTMPSTTMNYRSMLYLPSGGSYNLFSVGAGIGTLSNGGRLAGSAILLDATGQNGASFGYVFIIKRVS